MFGFINFHLRLAIVVCIHCSNLLDSELDCSESSSFLGTLFAFACLLAVECFQIDFVVLQLHSAAKTAMPLGFDSNDSKAVNFSHTLALVFRQEPVRLLTHTCILLDCGSEVFCSTLLRS